MIAQILNQQIDNGFSGIKGANLIVTIPITESLVNEIIAQQVKKTGYIDQSIIQILPNQEVNLTIKKLLTFRSKAKISKDIQFPQNPIITLEITGGVIGIFSQFASVLNNMLPNYIYFVSNTMKIDLSKAVDKNISSKIFPIIKSATITTINQKFLLNLSIKVGDEI